MQEEIVKLVVLSPVLSVSGFYEKPFRTSTEETIELIVGLEEDVVRGRADILVLNDQLWVTVIEAKGPHLSWSVRVPQTLTYMLSEKQPRPKRFGLITNGSDFIFIKLQKDTGKYGLCEPFSLFRRNELYNVVSILKSLANS